MITKIQTDNLRILKQEEMITPRELKKKYKAKLVAKHIDSSRKIISDIINGKDDRLLVISGPCSIHNTEEGLKYARKLAELKEKFPELFIVMRTYFEKPRTTIGWKGLINDPKLNGTYDINLGLEKAREFLFEVNKLGLATATEFLDPITTHFIADLVSWGAIGARTTESQGHREFSSGLSMPIGFKNATSGDIEIAKDSIITAQHPHVFLGVNDILKGTIISTTGNPDSHIILRGGKSGPNYKKEDIAKASEILENAGIETGIVIDASHANSNKDHTRQKIVCEDIAKQMQEGNKKIVGIMLESNLVEGKQKFNPLTDDKQNLACGVSITDACINLEQTEEILEMMNEANKKRNS